jgi:hypothetical protein
LALREAGPWLNLERGTGMAAGGYAGGSLRFSSKESRSKAQSAGWQARLSCRVVSGLTGFWLGNSHAFGLPRHDHSRRISHWLRKGVIPENASKQKDQEALRKEEA